MDGSSTQHIAVNEIKLAVKHIRRQSKRFFRAVIMRFLKLKAKKLQKLAINLENQLKNFFLWCGETINYFNDIYCAFTSLWGRHEIIPPLVTLA